MRLRLIFKSTSSSLHPICRTPSVAITHSVALHNFKFLQIPALWNAPTTILVHIQGLVYHTYTNGIQRFSFQFCPLRTYLWPPIPIYPFPKLLSQFSTIHNNSPSICNSNHIYKHDMDNKGILHNLPLSTMVNPPTFGYRHLLPQLHSSPHYARFFLPFSYNCVRRWGRVSKNHSIPVSSTTSITVVNLESHGK